MEITDFKLKKVIPRNTSLIGLIPDNYGLHLRITEDFEVTDLREVIHVPFSIENIGSGENAIFLNAYAGQSSVSAIDIINDLKQKYQKDLNEAFTIAYFELKTEAPNESEVFKDLDNFISTDVFGGQNWKAKKELMEAQQVFALLILVYRCARIDIDVSVFFNIQELNEEDIPVEKFKELTALPGVLLVDAGSWLIFMEIFTTQQIKYNNISWIQKAYQYFEPAIKLNPERVRSLLSQLMFRYIEDGVNRHYFTNSQIYDYVIKTFVGSISEPATICDPALGFGNTLLSVLSNNKDNSHIHIDGMEINSATYRFAGLNFMLHEEESMYLTNEDSFKSYQNATKDVIVSVPAIGKLDKPIQIQVGRKDSIRMHYLEERFLKLGIDGLKDNGRGYFIVPNSFLHRRSELKNYMLDKNLIEAIIQIPRVMREPVESSLIILNKSKIKTDLIFLANLSSHNLSSHNYEKKKIDFRLLLHDIKLEYDGFINDSHMDGQEDRHHLTNIQIVSNLDKGILLPSYYIFRRSRDLDRFLKRPNIQKLGNIILDIKSGINKFRNKDHESSDAQPVRLISAKDLKNHGDSPFFNYHTHDKKYYPLSYGNILKDECIIIPTFPDHHAVIFKPIPEYDFVLSRQLLAVHLDYSLILPEFFINQWNSDFFKIQFDRYASTGSSFLPSISISSLKDIYIEIPSLDEQRRIIALSKEGSSQFSPTILSSSIDHKKMYDAMKHYIGNRVIPINGYIQSLQNYLSQLHLISGGKMTDPISKFENLTIDDALFKISSFIEDVGSLAVNIQKLYEIDSPLLLKRQGLNHTINKLCRKYSGPIEYNVKGENAILSVDESCFSIVVENLFTNFKKHGIEGINSPKVEFEIMSRNEEDYVEIYYKNNGNPFPSDYSFDDFLNTNKGAGANSGTGLGGTLIRMAIEKHQGLISPITIHEMAPDGWNVVLKIKLNRHYV